MDKPFRSWALFAGLVMLFTPSETLGSTCTLVDNECPPGRIRNADGIESFQDITYNSTQDFYLVVYRLSGQARGIPLFPDGSIGSEIAFGSTQLVQDVVVEYNPDENEFLVVWRYDAAPLQVWGRYLTGDGSPLGTPFLIASGGNEPRIAYSSSSQRYIVLMSGVGLGTHYAIVAGASTAPAPLLQGKTNVEGVGFSGRIAYSSVSNKFLIVYVTEGANANVWGRFLAGDGSGFVSGVFAIGVDAADQQIPEVGYSPSNDEFMVSYEDWVVGFPPDVRFKRISGAGVVGPRQNLTVGGDWDQPGPIGYNPQTGEFIATFFDGLTSGWVREVQAGTGTLDDLVKFGGLNSRPLGIAIRPDPDEPQAAVVWKNFLGEDGIHVSFVELDPPPPLITSTTLPNGSLGVAYSGAVPVTGGITPLTFSFVPGFGPVPPGLSGPNPSTGAFSGEPSALGTFNFRVRVEDAIGRFDEKTMTLVVTLAAPTPISPTTTTNNNVPQFQWTASQGATSYDLVVDNLTDGGTVINQSVAGTSFTPGSPLASGKIYGWRVRATAGANIGPFSPQAMFELDSIAPPQVLDVAAGPLTETKYTGLTIVNSSGFQTGFGPEKTVDGDVTTIYASPGRTSMQEEHITYDLGASKAVGRVRIHSRENFGTLMPRNFVIELSENPTTGFVAAHTVTNFSAPASPAQWFTFDFPPASGRYVKLRVTQTNQFSDGKYYLSFNELELWQTSPPGSVRLTWTAPPDDNSGGTVAAYDIRFTTDPVFNFGTATPVGAFPPPVPAGGLQALVFTGLDPNLTYRFALVAIDDAGNISAVSNVAIVPPFALVLTATTVTTTELFQALSTVTAGSGFMIQSPGAVTFRAGSHVALTNGFSVGLGATFVAGNGPPFEVP